MDGHVKHHLNLAVNKISLLETTCKVCVCCLSSIQSEFTLQDNM